MNIPRKTTTQWLRSAAAVLALSGAVMTMAGCSNNASNDASATSDTQSATSEASQQETMVYQRLRSNRPILLQITGQDVIITEMLWEDDPESEQALKDAANGNLDPTAEYVDDTGVINSGGVVAWSDGNTWPISYDSSSAVIDGNAWFPFDSTPAQQQRSENGFTVPEN